MIVTSPNQNLRLLLVCTQKRRDHFLRIIPHTIHNQLLHTPQTRCTAMRVTLRFPRVRCAFGTTSYFNGRFRSVRIVLDVIDSFTGAWLKKTALGLGRFWTTTLFILETNDGARELKVDFALDFAATDAFATGCTARAPLFRYESGRKGECKG